MLGRLLRTRPLAESLLDRGRPNGGRADVGERDAPAAPSDVARRAAWICFQRRSGEAGMSTCLMPSGASASQTALMTAAVAAIVPASPIPLTPRSLVGDGVTVFSECTSGTSFIVGML